MREREFFAEHEGIPESLCTFENKEDESRKIREVFGLDVEY